MKRVFSLFLILGFTSIALFGILAMEHTMDHSGSCIPGLMATLDCPMGKPLVFLASHLDVFKSISVTLSQGRFFATLLGLILATALSTLAFVDVSEKKQPVLFWQPGVQKDLVSYVSKRHFVQWLALSENSPAIS